MPSVDGSAICTLAKVCHGKKQFWANLLAFHGIHCRLDVRGSTVGYGLSYPSVYLDSRSKAAAYLVVIVSALCLLDDTHPPTTELLNDAGVRDDFVDPLRSWRNVEAPSAPVNASTG